MIIADFDYCLANDGIIYLVKGYYHTRKSIIAYPVYWPDPSGDRQHPVLGRYVKNVTDFNDRLFAIQPPNRKSQYQAKHRACRASKSAMSGSPGKKWLSLWPVKSPVHGGR